MARNTKRVTKKGLVPHKILSDRGVRLEKAQRTSENSNIRHGQTAFMWENPNGEKVPVKVGQRCPKCNKRVRGIHHEEGNHHKGIVVECSR